MKFLRIIFNPYQRRKREAGEAAPTGFAYQSLRSVVAILVARATETHP
jgi:hypothetical protein